MSAGRDTTGAARESATHATSQGLAVQHRSANRQAALVRSSRSGTQVPPPRLRNAELALFVAGGVPVHDIPQNAEPTLHCTVREYASRSG